MIYPNNNGGQQPPFNPFMMWGPHPGPPPMMQQQPPQFNQNQGMPNLMHGFFDSSGNFDMNKMMSSVGKMQKLYSQTQPMIKQLSPLLSFFKK